MRGVFRFLAPRLLRALIAVWLVSTVVFVVMRLSGDPVPLLLPPDAPRSEIFRVRRELGLDRPLPAQYGVFLANALRGDFGRSIHFREPAFAVVRGYLGATVELGLTAFLLAAIVAVPVGLLSAVKRNSPIDHVAMGMALVGQSAPTFFLGILGILLLALKADLFPTGGRGDWTHLALPALTLGAFAMASIARVTRSAVLEVLRADYIRTARAKGVAEWLVVVKHTLKNAALPIVTITGLQFGTLLGGAGVTETAFAWPGLGRLALQSIHNRDYPVRQRAGFLSAIVLIMINFAIDLLYGVLEPRARRPVAGDLRGARLVGGRRLGGGGGRRARRGARDRGALPGRLHRQRDHDARRRAARLPLHPARDRHHRGAGAELPDPDRRDR